MILVDTTFMIDALHPGTRSNRVVSNWLLAEETVNVPALVWTELMIGDLPQPTRDELHSLFPSPEPLFAADATKAAELFVRTGKRPGTLRECLIAAVCLRVRARLATLAIQNFNHFESFGLVLA